MNNLKIFNRNSLSKTKIEQISGGEETGLPTATQGETSKLFGLITQEDFNTDGDWLSTC